MRIYKVSLATIFGLIALINFLDGYFVMQTAQMPAHQTNGLLCYLISLMAFGFFALITSKRWNGCKCGPDCCCKQDEEPIKANAHKDKKPKK
ncbi:MAG: hypothetical protein LBR70_02655 [Lactobacillaceae bacterium]|jgi:hypothetical protein|nr:hypothetical protein [Lactobacillaceae bacterium]